ncbi:MULTISPECIES: hypothetical protein [Bacillus cereus group]|uniref:Uncharacterized protein n=1 Tax=Bacillus thuringiensis TaxID=1428 RepID=A0A9X6YFV1_BACTU|nr:MULTISPECIES: hypothetical protein [Bacillus cereus group]MCP1399804.1 hypothetical protein [Bacillus cereus]OBW85095.1 hypothetical protein A9L49_29220 [Bacillus cereus]PED13258.1 hypothetical protein CON01_17705 [Bacillus thuringiensis]PES42354.1 hypothetical protein CN499_29970 [Bacillus thuringiensis]PET89415.1 hypothetical protein CN527_31750 [Bacillus cereus]
MNKSPYLLSIFGLGLFFSVRHGLLIFLAYWKDEVISSNNLILFAIGVLLLMVSMFFNKQRSKAKQV